MTRRWVDNRRYFREGGQAGIETKRGCPCRCVYCADPVAKGRQTRTRPPEAVADEVERLLEQGITETLRLATGVVETGLGVAVGVVETGVDVVTVPVKTVEKGVGAVTDTVKKLLPIGGETEKKE